MKYEIAYENAERYEDQEVCGYHELNKNNHINYNIDLTKENTNEPLQ